MFKRINEISVNATLATIVYLQTVSVGSAQSNFGDLTDNVDQSITNVPSLIATASYIIGAGFVVMGLIKFNKARSHPQQADTGGAIIQVVVGAALIVIPLIITAVAGSFGNGGNTLSRPTL